MPPKRKLHSSIPPNVASAIAYTDQAGTAANKRSKLSKPAPKASTNGESNNDSAIVTQGRGDIDEEPSFDASRSEERAGIVDRRYYPAEMNNERCAMYNANEIPRPIEIFNKTLQSTRTTRNEIKQGDPGEAVIHWFKRDLRLRDNTALSEASKLAKEKGIGLIAVWILSPQDWEAHLVSPAKCDFELRSLSLLQRELAEIDIPLYTTTVPERRNVPKRVLELAVEWNVKNIFCNLEYEPDELRREEKLVRLGVEKGVNVEAHHDDCVVPPGSLKTGAGRQYAVYTPWYRAWVAHLHAHPHLLNERPMPTANPLSFRTKHASLFNLPLPSVPDSKTLTPEERSRFVSLWPAGETAALERLQLFLTEKIGRYTATRNFPSKASTACVSVHHAAGTLAARTSVRSARDVNSTKKLDGGIDGIKGWIGEVAWRDFYRHVLVNWPYVCMNKPFKYEYTNITWEYSPAHFAAWTQGCTGYPIVDAAMRCLASTAYMHNRLRMITASFLAKHLLLDWRLGEQYFLSHLIDGDFASNNGGWGFSSSTGVDPQPYFRIFNPWLQSEKFDPEGEFIRKWVRELRGVEGRGVHDPYGVGGEAERVARREGYPRPVVEHRVARERCLGRFKEGIGRGTA
ncbi:deoxyribodipyrimidine photo-lyase [Byssothecium circinans]|uniref:Deoxyribodipyrimidine photo-lyase n=1 Tax=Byssothecium circinans TaxID=147558 RepID=A0A6A5TQT2_9PLEO|nr:deoxyribodipyrimidine photo-lyase [Byssothecium circinans]